MRAVRRSTIPAILSAGLLVGCRFMTATPLAPALLDPYLRIQTALTDDTIDSISANARALADEADKVGRPGQGMRAAALKLRDARDVKDARDAFGELSEAVIAYGKSIRASAGEANRVAYCPMLNKPWIQSGDRIRNPYFGMAMLSCGSFRDTLR